jgi:hypothetical protein
MTYLDVSRNVYLIQLLCYFELAVKPLVLYASEIIAVQVLHLPLYFPGSVTCVLIAISSDWTAPLLHDVPEQNIDH